MTFISVLAGAAAPGLALLSYIYLKDRYQAEPLHLVGRLFLFGLLLVFPVMLFQRGTAMLLGDDPVAFAFLTTAAVEETAKWLIILITVFRHAEFDEPYDGIVYATAVSLGFATMENLFYVLSEPYSLSTILLRAILPVSGHALFGIIMGYYFGRAKFFKYDKARYLAYALIFPVFWHGLFDFVILSAANWVWLMIPLMAVLWIRGLTKMKRANSYSPLRMMAREEEFKM